MIPGAKHHFMDHFTTLPPDKRPIFNCVLQLLKFIHKIWSYNFYLMRILISYNKNKQNKIQKELSPKIIGRQNWVSFSNQAKLKKKKIY